MSSCSRRELARRRAGRTPVLIQVLLLTIVIVVGLAAFVLGHGGF